MIDIKKSGYLVESKSGVGRTFHDKGLINEKVPVYLCTKFGENEKLVPGLKVPLIFSDKAILCDPNSLKMIGFID
jgi:hypothetical protein